MRKILSKKIDSLSLQQYWNSKKYQTLLVMKGHWNKSTNSKNLLKKRVVQLYFNMYDMQMQSISFVAKYLYITLQIYFKISIHY